MTEMTKRMILFSGSVNPELAEEIAKYLNVNLGNIKHEKFANGEIYARYQESIRGADVFLIQSVCGAEGYDVNDALMELRELLCAGGLWPIAAGAFIGALIIGILDNGLNLMGVNSDWQYIIKGVVILGAVYMDFLRSRKRASGR